MPVWRRRARRMTIRPGCVWLDVGERSFFGKKDRDTLAPPHLPLRHLLLCAGLAFLAGCAAPRPACLAPGHWASPATLHAIPDPIPAARAHAVVLLGERHDSAADHAWELDTIRQLAAANPTLMLGFEMFPRAAQPALDAWVAGRLTEAAFLHDTDWAHVWGFPPPLYMPIFRFARDHHIPMLALNVSHRLVHLTAQKGFAAIPQAEREGIGMPAPPSAGYRADLADAMGGHGGPAITKASLDHFIEAQLVWDRAMAEAIAAHAHGRPVVALMGAGHLEHRYGVPHQLADLGILDAMVLLAVHDLCSAPGADYADAIYGD